MSPAKVAPEGLKPQECERNLGRSKPQIPFIPKKDNLQEAVESSTNTLKLTLPHKVELRVPVWSKGTPEQFLVHVQQALDAIWQKGLDTVLEKAVEEASEAFNNYKGKNETPPKKESGKESQ